MTSETYNFAREQIVNNTKEIDISMLKLEIERKQSSIKLLELNMAFKNGENSPVKGL